ncbi:MAG: hypothetical protein L0Z62_13435 [Gemmataceae bacterium]|nr:hypothetical protein [Gemmataceae bacterium]
MLDQTFAQDAPAISAERIERQIEARTGRRVRQLRVDCAGNRVSVEGLAASYHVKQLALSAVRELLPTKPVDLHIEVR